MKLSFASASASAYILALASAFAFIITACDKDPISPADPLRIDLQAPVVGQENHYLRYSGACGQLEPTGDTLILKIKSFNGIDMELEESFTPGSPNFTTQPYTYPAKWNAEVLEIAPEYRWTSALFFFYGSDSLRLKQNPTVNLLQNNCIVWDGQTDFVGDYIGTIPLFKVGSHEYAQKKIVSCVPTIVDLDAYLVYDKNNIYSSFTSSEGGWFPTEDPMTFAYALMQY